MILGAQKLDGKKIRTGRTVYFTSIDLKTWDFKGDFWAPNLFCMHEMPDIFKLGDYWYLLTTEYSDKSKIVYRMSKTRTICITGSGVEHWWCTRFTRAQMARWG
jgi:beta-fructofuranosidase